MNEKELRSKLIRLAHAKPEIRKDLLPVLRKHAARKINVAPKLAKMLAAAGRRGVVPGGMDATFAQAYRAQDHGLLQMSPKNAQVLVLTDKGRQALTDGFYYK